MDRIAQNSIAMYVYRFLNFQYKSDHFRSVRALAAPRAVEMERISLCAGRYLQYEFFASAAHAISNILPERIEFRPMVPADKARKTVASTFTAQGFSSPWTNHSYSRSPQPRGGRLELSCVEVEMVPEKLQVQVEMELEEMEESCARMALGPRAALRGLFL